jgi:hypothetical protein
MLQRVHIGNMLQHVHIDNMLKHVYIDNMLQYVHITAYLPLAIFCSMFTFKQLQLQCSIALPPGRTGRGASEEEVYISKRAGGETNISLIQA